MGKQLVRGFLSLAAVPLLVCATAAPARAQGYVSASLLGDIARFDRVESSGRNTNTGSGEAIGFALRLGTALGSRWGVELEFAHPSQIETEVTPEFFPLLTDAPAIPGLPGVVTPAPTTILPYSYSIQTKQRNTTLAASAWIGQRVSSKFSLSYLAGIAFGRTSRDIDITYGIGLFSPTIFPPRVSTSSTTYDVGPLVGIEGAIVLTEHVQLVPGFRLHGIEGGWLLRPSVGLGWVF